jgi:hypothetical protein
MVTGFKQKPLAKVVILPEKVYNNGVWYTITAVAEKAFAYTDLEGIMLPDTVISIGAYAFYKPTKLKAVMMGNSVT